MRTWVTCSSVVGAWYFAEYVPFLWFQLFVSRSLLFSSPSAPIPPPMSTHTIHAALVRSTGPSLGTFIHSLFQLLTILTIFIQNLPFDLRRIPWVPLATPLAIFDIPGVGWVVRFLKDEQIEQVWFDVSGLTGEPFWVPTARAGVLIDKGRERSVSVEADGN